MSGQTARGFWPLVGLAAGLIILGCEEGPQSGRGFHLPSGDTERGKLAFVALSCHRCHSVASVDLPPLEGPREMDIALGGEVRRVKTYGQLVTSIIDPSFTLAHGYRRELIAENGQSRMQDFNEQMTVQQLIDIVTFLQSRYKVVYPDWPEHYYLTP